ncbi:MAG: quinone oxidoreductase [Betaproteobacteria bacterium]
MPFAIRIHQTGGPEVLQWEEVAVGDPGPGEVLIRHTAIGVNYIDTYHRSGLYPLPMPATIGREAAGFVEALGPGVTEFATGDRVTYCTGSLGSYSEMRVAPVERLIKLPDGITDVQAASMMLKGLTVQYLLRRTYPLKSGDTVLFHAAAGGVGQLASQWTKALGVTMIGTVGTDEKAALAAAHGCAHTIVYTRENFTERTRELTGGKGVPVVYDGVGKDTFLGSLDCLSRFGLLVVFGNASGPVTNFNIGILAQKGSLFLTRPTLDTYTSTRAELLAMADDLFGLVLAGKIKVEPSKVFALKDAAEAHRELESRRTTGSMILVP